MKSIKILWVILAIFAILAPFVSVTVFALALPPQYSNTFVGGLNEKVDRLNAIKEEKIVVVGGSSVAFGIDSAMIERYTGKPVVNFGLYAALGTKLMLDLSRSGIRKGDIVILSPEIDAQTLSLYFSAENTWKALDDDVSMAWRIRGENRLSLLGGVWKFAGEKYGYYKDGAPDPSGVYNAKNLNRYGDVDYPRPQNVMALAYDPNTIVSLSEQIVDPAFLDYLNAYIRFCQKKGARVYFSYCPINRLAIDPATTEESKAAFAAFLSGNLDCPVIGEIDDCILDAGYFYDTNFHLNDDGVVVRTVRLLKDLFFAEEDPTFVDEPIPPPPALAHADVRYDEVDPNAVYFTYRHFGEQNAGYVITGLTEEGKRQKTLTIPFGAESYRVIAIGPAAFAGSEVERIVIPAGSFIGALLNDESETVGCFDGAEHLRRLDIYLTYEEVYPINPCAMHTPEGFEIHSLACVDLRTTYNPWEAPAGGQLLSELTLAPVP